MAIAKSKDLIMDIETTTYSRIDSVRTYSNGSKVGTQRIRKYSSEKYRTDNPEAVEPMTVTVEYTPEEIAQKMAIEYAALMRTEAFKDGTKV